MGSTGLSLSTEEMSGSQRRYGDGCVAPPCSLEEGDGSQERSLHGLEVSRQQEDGRNEGIDRHETPALRFFHNPDLCTLLCKTMITQAALDSNDKPCLADRSASALLAFRGVTRQAWGAAMLEKPSRLALNLTPRDETVEGILAYLDEPVASFETQGHRPDWPGQFHAIITQSEADVNTLHVLENDDPLHRIYHRRGLQARIITHHRAVVHEHIGPLRDSRLFIPAKQLETCFSLPLALEMFLTQPPQKNIRFGIRYEYQPGKREYFEITNESGIRLGDLAAHFAREPGLMKKPIDPRHEVYRYRRWLRDSEFAALVRVTWEYKRAMVKGHRYERDARSNSEMYVGGRSVVQWT